MNDIHSSNKPLLLIQMEDFIQYELSRPSNRLLDTESINESRWEVFSECFDVFIAEFSTYRPVLLRIKSEFEEILARCLKKVHHIRSIERKLSTMEGERAREIAELRREHQTELDLRDAKIDELVSHINAIKAKHQDADRMLSESAKQRQKLTEQWRDAERSSKTFYSEIKKMQCAQEEAERSRDRSNAELRDLMVANRKMAESYESVMNDLKRLQDEMDKTPQVSSKEIEEKDQKIKTLTDRVSEQRALYQSLMADHQKLLDLYKDLTKQRQLLTAKYATLMAHDGNSRPVTPRPNWAKAVELKFMSKESIEGKSTDDIMSLMATTLNQLEEKVEVLQSMVPDDRLKDMARSDESMFLEVDYDATTPKYLRYRGTIRKKRMAKRDCERMIASIWSRKYERCLFVVRLRRNGNGNQSAVRSDIQRRAPPKCRSSISSTIFSKRSMGSNLASWRPGTLCAAHSTATATTRTANCSPPF